MHIASTALKKELPVLWLEELPVRCFRWKHRSFENPSYARLPREVLAGGLDKGLDHSKVKSVLSKLGHLWNKQDSLGMLEMEFEARDAAIALIFHGSKASGRQDSTKLLQSRAEAIFYYLGSANQRLLRWDSAMEHYQEQVFRVSVCVRVYTVVFVCLYVLCCRL